MTFFIGFVFSIYNSFFFFLCTLSIPFLAGWPSWRPLMIVIELQKGQSMLECQCSTLIYFIITRTLCLISFVFFFVCGCSPLSVPLFSLPFDRFLSAKVACLPDRCHKKVSHHLASIMQRSRPPNSRGAREWASGLHTHTHSPTHTCVYKKIKAEQRRRGRCGRRGWALPPWRKEGCCSWVPATVRRPPLVGTALNK